MNKRILLVDDEHDVISAYQRNLRKKFNIKTALSGREAIRIVDESAPFAVVVSDYRMPEMDGIKLLERLRKSHPDTIRIIITGYADLQTAVDAVNLGNVFRFLTKPVPMKALIEVLNDSAEIHRLIVSEKELLSKTLKGSIKILIDILSEVQPEAFSRASRIRSIAKEIAERRANRNVWEVEIASLLSQIGLIAVPSEVIKKKFSGVQLSREEEKMIASQPENAYKLLSNIPRIENIAEGIRCQNINFDGSNTKNFDMIGSKIPFIGRVLRICNDFDQYTLEGYAKQDALIQLQKNSSNYDTALLKALSDYLSGKDSGPQIKSIAFKNLRIGMTLTTDLCDSDGNVLVKKGNEITDVSLMRLIHMSKVKEIKEPIMVIEEQKS